MLTLERAGGDSQKKEDEGEQQIGARPHGGERSN